MNYAFTNGKILDGTKDMQVQTGLCILVQDGVKCRMRVPFVTQESLFVNENLIL